MRFAIDYVNEIAEFHDFESGYNILTTSFIMACVHVGLLLGPLIAICCIAVKCRQHCCFKVMVIVTCCIEIALCIPISILAVAAQNSFEEKETLMTRMNDLVYGCTDEYTFIPDDVMEE